MHNKVDRVRAEQRRKSNANIVQMKLGQNCNKIVHIYLFDSDDSESRPATSANLAITVTLPSGFLKSSKVSSLVAEVGCY